MAESLTGAYLIDCGLNFGDLHDLLETLQVEIANADAPTEVLNGFHSMKRYQGELCEASLLDLLELRPITFPVLDRSRVMDQVEIDLFDIEL